MRLTIRSSAPALLGAALLSLAACAGGPAHHATSIVSYLYPDRRDQVETVSIPELRLPLRVGVAFVPAEADSRNGCYECRRAGFSETQRMTLMKEVAAHFKDPAMVKTIEIIPSSYLTPRGSFANLDQLRSMFGVDVIALISYDQIQFTDEGRTSLTYWTLVGAYLVEGEKNDTRTLIDAVVYDIPSRRLLFRAPGVSTVKGSSTPVNLSEELRRDSEKGFRVASADLVTNLDEQLAAFKTKVKEAPEEYHVTRGSGSGDGGKGAGSIDGWFVAVVSTLAFAMAVSRQTRRA
jgi:rhombotail lipoprotein